MTKRILIVAFSAGWTLPLWLTVYSGMSHWYYEVVLHLNGQEELHSFPYLRLMFQSLTVTCIWLAAVSVFWAWNLTEKKEKE